MTLSNIPSEKTEKTEKTEKIVLLANLGTPKSYLKKDVKDFLTEFLMDKRVIPLPYFLRFLLIRGIIIPLRLNKVCKVYRTVWCEKENGSPLKIYQEKLVSKLNLELKNKNFKIFSLMRYGEPSIKTIFESRDFENIKNIKNIKEIILLPLYPQFSATTTGSLFDAFARFFRKKNNFQAYLFKIINFYYDHPDYIQTISRHIQNHSHLNSGADPTSLLIFSFHGLPEINIQKGEPYLIHCQQTAEKIAEALHLEQSQWQIAFQSRVGAQRWLQPYLDQLLISLPKKNIKKIAIVCPGFPIDCIETLEEINIQNRALFLNSGGVEFEYIPALNDHELHVEFLKKLIQNY